jgi:hypothetical protein
VPLISISRFIITAMNATNPKVTTKPEVLLDKIHAEFPDLI